MSRALPIFGVDATAENQAGLDWARAASGGCKFAIHKVGQGCRWVPDGFVDFFRASERHVELQGFYYFIDDTRSGKAQAHHMVEVMHRVGGPRGRLLAVDFEWYKGDGWDHTPHNNTLWDFCRELKAQTNNHSITCYSTPSFWDGGDPTGPVRPALIDATWKAQVRSVTERINHPKAIYPLRRLRYGWSGFGGVTPLFWQYTWGGRWGGVYCDTNAYRGTKDKLLALAGGKR